MTDFIITTTTYDAVPEAPPTPKTTDISQGEVYKDDVSTVLVVAGRVRHLGWMDKYIGSRLPVFSKEEMDQLDAEIAAIWAASPDEEVIAIAVFLESEAAKDEWE